MSRENKKLKNKPGSPAVGDDEFFGREEELERLIQKVTDGNSVHISAPRRIGKTSLMRQAENDLKDSGHICFRHNLEGFKSPSDWMYKLAEDMYKNASFTESITAIIKNVILSGESDIQDMLRSAINSERWHIQGVNFFKALYDSCPNEKRIVVFLDELAVMIEKMQKEQDKELRRTEAHEEVTHFITWLRSIHQNFHGKISFVAASSIGLLPLLERLNLSVHVNYFADFFLEAWDAETSKECILALARGKEIKISDETAGIMTEMIMTSGRCSPYYVQVFFSVANDNLFSKERDSYSKDELSEIYRKYLIRGNAISPTLNHAIERLEKSLSSEEYNLAEQILSKLAQNGEITAKSKVKNIKSETNEKSFRYVLNILKHDGYIEETDDGYYFRDKPLRDWWRNKYGK